MKRTANYALPDWEKSDFIKMDDFNDLTRKLDAALKAGADAQTALQEAVNAVKSTAEGAYSPANKPYVQGTYTGNGSSQTIDLGFKPSYLIISAGMDVGAYTASHGSWAGTEAQLGAVMQKVLQFTSTGFKVTNSVYNNADYPALWINSKNSVYSYIALK